MRQGIEELSDPPMVHAGNSVSVSATGTKPVSNPTAFIVAFSSRVQGLLNPDCVTV